MKTIGILGGLGPQATTDMEVRIHKAAQALIPQAQNSGYPPMIVSYYRHPPILLTNEFVPVSPWQPDPRLLSTAQQLGTIADFLIIASNGVHMFQKEIEQASGKKVLSMIDTTMEEVKRKGWKRIGVLGLMNGNIYANKLKAIGLEPVLVDNMLQGELNQAIFRVMEARHTAEDKNTALLAIEKLRMQNVDGIIPGCTELPFMLSEQVDANDIINPVQFLAEAAVKYSLG